jgi:hypothetical protein
MTSIDEYRKTLQRRIQQAGAKVYNNAKSTVPVDTGALRSTIDIDQRPNGFTVSAGGSGVDYAPAQEYGTMYQSGRSFLGLRTGSGIAWKPIVIRILKGGN